MLASRFSRRDFIKATSLLAVPLWLRAAVPGSAAPGTPGYAYVGTYTPNGGGIYLFSQDRSNGALTQLQVLDDARNPTWLALNAAQTRLFAISEIDDYQGKHSGAVVSYAIDPSTRQLQKLSAVSSAGTNPCHLSVHPSGRYLFVANYGGGSVAVIPVDERGALGEATDVRPSVGPRHRPRAVDEPPGQFAVSDHDAAHVHMVAMDPSGQFVIGNDAGLDLTLVWRFDAQAGRLLPADVPVLGAPSGAAPRHFVFHPNGQVFYNLYEQDSKVAVYDYDAAKGAFKQKQLISTLPPKFAGSNLTAEIIISHDGRFLYVSNRLHNSIAIFAVADDGLLRMIGESWTHADFPRSLTLDAHDGFLYSCNQRGDSITCFRANATTGSLQFTGRFEPVGSPAVMVMLK